MNFDIFTNDDKSGLPSDTTKRAWISFLFILLIGLILLIIMFFKQVNEQVISFFQFLASLLGITGPGAYTIKRVTENKQTTDIKQNNPIDNIVTIQTKEFDYDYNTQRDNVHNPSSSCNVTSLQMLLSKYISITDDELWEHCNSDETKQWAIKNIGNWVKPYCNTNSLNQVHGVLCYIANKVVGKKIAVTYSVLTIDKMRELLINGKTILLGGYFTSCGHIIAVIDYNDEGFIVMDPWGDWNSGYRDHDGNKKVYRYNQIKRVITGNGVVIG